MKTRNHERRVRIAAGIVIWGLAIGAAIWWSGSKSFPLPDRGWRLAHDLWQFSTAERRLVALAPVPTVWIEAGDPIYVIDRSGGIRQIGEVQRVNGPSSTDREMCALFYPGAPPIAAGDQLKGYVTPRSLDWVVQTMLPQQKRDAIRAEISAAYEAYHNEVFDALKPVAQQGLRQVLLVVQEELRKALENHRPELEHFAEHYQQTILNEQLLPLIRTRIWPIVKTKTEPLANQIGQEIWSRASLWRFGWRYLYDKSPLPDRNLTEAEWSRFVAADVIPVLQQHTDDFITTQREIIVAIVHHAEVQATVRNSLTKILNDGDFQDLVWEILQEAIFKNARLQATIRRQWQSPQAQQAARLTSARVEATVRRIGDLLLGTREEGISPEFAQVLRNQILDKDCRWFVLEHVRTGPVPDRAAASDPVLPVLRGSHPAVNPFAVTMQGIRP